MNLWTIAEVAMFALGFILAFAGDKLSSPLLTYGGISLFGVAAFLQAGDDGGDALLCGKSDDDARGVRGCRFFDRYGGGTHASHCAWTQTI